MGCCCCGHKPWTKTFISFTIIFCLAQIGALIFTLYISHDESYGKNEIFKTLYSYLVKNEYTLGLSITSIVVNFLWIFINIDVLVNLRHTEIKQSLVTSLILWDIAAIVSFIIDAVSIILYGLDIDNKKNYYAEMYMIIISTRFLIGFLFNIFAIIGMIIITNLCRNKLGKQPKTKIVQLKPPQPVLKKPIREAYLEENNIDRVRDWHNHYEEKNDYQRNPTNGNAPNYIPKFNDVPKTNNSAWNTNSHNNDPAHNHALIGSNTNVLVNGVPSGTLRRQLPWSYMPPNELPHMQPRKQPAPVTTTPYVPAPDYYQKNPKPISRRDFHEPGWSQHL